MDIKEIIEKNKRNIWQAIDDYRAHTSDTEVLEDITDSFVDRLAKDNAYAKRELRQLFRTSPAWNEELDALVINGTRTHNPDYERIRSLANDILAPAYEGCEKAKRGLLNRAINFFAIPKGDKASYIMAIQKLAPKAYAPNKKRSRIFKSLCDELGISDDTAGSDFQRLYAQFADELSAKKIDFKFFVSLNPAHFLTMSNPKSDNRGSMLTSCHSLNSTEYAYNNGCSGYARDNYSFITFVVADPNSQETLNNRKTMRQIFAYKPGNGLLLQSRLYNTDGGTYGAQAASKVYRDLVQREISQLEQAPNLWQTYNYFNNFHITISAGEGFGGYPDWMYRNFGAKISIRRDKADSYEQFYVGTYGLCICCGSEINTRLYCSDCGYDEENDNRSRCEECEDHYEDIYPVYNTEGQEIYVCANCRDRDYAYCSDCDNYYPKEVVVLVENEDSTSTPVCPHCLEEHYKQCICCGRWGIKGGMEDGACPKCKTQHEREMVA